MLLICAFNVKVSVATAVEEIIIILYAYRESLAKDWYKIKRLATSY